MNTSNPDIPIGQIRSSSTAPDDEPTRILIVANDPIVCDSLSNTLRRQGYSTATAFSGEEALESIIEARRVRTSTRAPSPFRVVLTDINVTGSTGLELIRTLYEENDDLVVVVVTAYGTIESAVKAIKLGAFDYLTYPIVENELALVVEKATRQAHLLARNSMLERELDDRYGFDRIIGRDPRMIKIYDLIQAVAPTNTTVLMTGESGTGKSLIAKAIHRHSAVLDGPFVEISCGSIPETLLESELFGHVKGAFTGAHADKIGKFLAADQGTLFLDEINSASAGMQLKLLRVLQERKFEPVGSTETVEVNVRVLLATNEPLEGLVREGVFRQDLYYRINVVSIELPPLRERVTDIPLLAEFFLEKYSREHDRRIAGFTAEALAALQEYEMPGNVRELENIVQRAVVLTRRGVIDVDDLPAQVINNQSWRFEEGKDSAVPAPLLWHGEPLTEAVEAQERLIILAALDANGWNRRQTADQLKINRTTLYKKIKHYGLDQWHVAG